MQIRPFRAQSSSNPLCFPHFVLYLLRGILRNPRCQRLRALCPGMLLLHNRSATLHNLSTLGVSLRSMTDLLPEEDKLV